jgi:Fur family ferric uptake transcriptional regulator
MNEGSHHAKLQQSGLKCTRQRRAVLEILEQADQPVSAEQVFMALRENAIPASLSTVYRILDTLSDKALILRLDIAGDNRSLYEYNRMVHKHYLVCVGCRKIFPIENCPLGVYEEALERQTHFAIIGHRLDIYGYCPDCQQKGLAKER